MASREGGGMEYAASASILKKENYFMKRQRKNDRTINIYKILTIVLAVVFIVVLIIFGRSWMVQKNAQKEYEKLSAQVNDLQNQVNDNQINIPSDTQTETEKCGTGSAGPKTANWNKKE